MLKSAGGTGRIFRQGKQRQHHLVVPARPCPKIPPAPVESFDTEKKGNIKQNTFFSQYFRRGSVEHPQQAKKSDTGRHSRNGDASQVLEVERVQQVLGVRVDVDRILLDSRDLVIGETGGRKRVRKPRQHRTFFITLLTQYCRSTSVQRTVHRVREAPTAIVTRTKLEAYSEPAFRIESWVG